MKKKVEVRLSHPEHTNMYLCEKCFCWDGEFYKKSTELHEPMWLAISCLCNSAECNKCGNKRKIPGTSIWALYDDSIAYVPYFPERLPCSKCGDKMVN
jgi:hypothetical protein